MSKHDFKTFNFLVLCIIVLGLATAVKSVKVHSPHFLETTIEETGTVATTTPVLAYVPQFVLISFDGSRSDAIWKDIRLFENQMKASSTPLTVTHFINAAYLLTNETKHLYKGPAQTPGKTNIGVSEDIEHMRTRINEINLAVAAGDEIASHTVGHFSGALWTKDEWREEFDSFAHIVSHLDEMYPDAHLPKLNVSTSTIIGFRAPYLDKSPGLYEALHEAKVHYDSSEVASGDEWPTKDTYGMWHIPLGTMKIGKSQHNVLAMDYNIYVRDSQAVDTIKKGTPEWDRAYNDTLEAFLGYFAKNYAGKRAPVLVGYHFQGWNDGAYWEAMKEFAREVCGKPQVKCGTFRDLVEYMDKYGVPPGAAHSKMTAAPQDAVMPDRGSNEHNE